MTDDQTLSQDTQLLILRDQVAFLSEQLMKVIDRSYGEQVARGLHPLDGAAQLAAMDRQGVQQAMGQLAQRRIQEAAAKAPTQGTA